MQNSNTSQKIKRLTATAMFCALAYVCTVLIKIPVQFLTLDLKDSLIILCSLLFGPVSGLSVAVIVPFFEFLTISGTGVYGLIMNVLSSVTFAAVTGLIYHRKKSMSGAVIGLLSGASAVTAVMILANLFITPYYLGTTTAVVAQMIPKILLPFNLIKAVLNAAIVLLLYKPLSRILKRFGFIRGASAASSPEHEKSAKKRSILVSVIAVAVIAVSLLIIFLVLRA
ncbi:MAG: ECF transporter S component [Clostridia bacterium]|nr:ECF transporter S component [Clostridia bacterium]